jgi:hypothetical protein
MMITEARELFDKIVGKYDNWTLNEGDDTRIIPNERGILTLSNEVMKEALIAIQEKEIKSIDLLKLSERGIKLPIDEPCFPIQVHVISPTEVKEKVIHLLKSHPLSILLKLFVIKMLTIRGKFS